MCGRFVQSSPLPRLISAFGVESCSFQFAPHYNIAPSQNILTIRLDERGKRQLTALQWGFVPHWAKDMSGPHPINARAETVAEKPMFRDSFKRHRCLVPADAFYEWQALETGKQPFCIRRKDAKPFAFGAIWDRWEKEGKKLETVSILVTSANSLMSQIHDRMPVILPSEAYGTWLTPGPLRAEAKEELLVPISPDGWIAYPVSRDVNKPQNDFERLMMKARPGQD